MEDLKNKLKELTLHEERLLIELVSQEDPKAQSIQMLYDGIGGRYSNCEAQEYSEIDSAIDELGGMDKWDQELSCCLHRQHFGVLDEEEVQMILDSEGDSPSAGGRWQDTPVYDADYEVYEEALLAWHEVCDARNNGILRNIAICAFRELFSQLLAEDGRICRKYGVLNTEEEIETAVLTEAAAYVNAERLGWIAGSGWVNLILNRWEIESDWSDEDGDYIIESRKPAEDAYNTINHKEME